MSGIGKTVPQWGVRYGDGEVEGPFSSERDARDWIRIARTEIAEGRWEGDDYEPMTLMDRVWHLEISDWQEVPTTGGRDDHGSEAGERG